MKDGESIVGEEKHAAPKGFFRRYLWSYDHKVVAKQYLFTALLFLLAGMTLASIIRWELAFPARPMPLLGRLAGLVSFFSGDGSVTPGGYLQVVTMHGTIMIFFVIIPLLVGVFGNFLIPLQVGARDVAFPLLNEISYWLYAAAGVVLLSSFAFGQGPASAGWTAYPPLSDLSGAAPGSGLGQILWLSALLILGFSSILGGVNFLTTIVMLRAPGLTWGRLPLLTWSQLVTAVFQTLATPALAAALILLMVDKVFNTSFFLPAGLYLSDQASGHTGGGSPLLWQHIFWFYSHPAVYIMILPGMGIASELISCFSRKPISGYPAMVASLLAIMGLSFVVWGHHMFVSGMNTLLGTAFMVTTMIIALPSGVKVFNWLGTLWGGSLRFHSPLIAGAGFVSMFIMGGLSGLLMAATPVDIYIHDTFYVVGHFHYIVFGGTLFSVFGGIYFWFPKLFGRMANEKAAKIHLILTFIALNCTFFPMYYLGQAGHMRRLYTPTEYEFLQGVQHVNVFITLSAYVLISAQAIFFFNILWSLFKGPKAPDNPWESNTLEWTTATPVPSYNFEKIPNVYRGPYEYSSPEAARLGRDWISQSEKEA